MGRRFLSWLVAAVLVSAQSANGAPADAEVLQFPGFDGPLPSKHYAGYITVGNQPHKRHYYYYFATSERSLEDPLTVWINGGPGCSLFCGLLELIGPLYIDHDLYHTGQAKLKQNPFSWTKVSNIIFVDNPAGAGYSYADKIEDYTTNDTMTVSDLYEFILKWFSKYPEFLPNPLYLAGCSYSGVMVPVVAQLIVNGNEAGSELKLNFKGYSIANGAIDLDLEINAKIPFAYQMGLISEGQYKDLASSCNERYWNNNDPECLKNLENFQRNVAGIYKEHVLYRPCDFEMDIIMEADEYDFVGMYQSLQHKNDFSIHCHNRDVISKRLLDPETSRKILHAQPVEVTGEWIRCTKRINYKRDILSLIPYHLNITMKGYRAFIYSGDHDMVVPYTATLEAIKALNYSEIEKWRPWFVRNQIAGYMVQYEHNLLFATLKGAGHTPMEYMRHEVLVAYQRWIEGADFI